MLAKISEYAHLMTEQQSPDLVQFLYKKKYFLSIKCTPCSIQGSHRTKKRLTQDFIKYIFLNYDGEITLVNLLMVLMFMFCICLVNLPALIVKYLYKLCSPYWNLAYI
jgi:hypothetical protein